jgi:hypothetical protein
MMFDLPHPLGPTTAQRFEGKGTVVGSTKDLKPASLIACKRIVVSYSLLRECGTRDYVLVSRLLRRDRFSQNAIFYSKSPSGSPIKEIKREDACVRIVEITPVCK